MTLKQMCEQAAVYTDRADDFVTIPDPVDPERQIYDPEDDPGIWYQAMKTSINAAYREVARTLLMPDTRVETELGEDGSMTILPYAPVDESLVIEDAAIVDFTAFTAGEESQPLELHEDDLFRLVQEGELTEADASALTVGSMLVITTDESGVQNIVIHQPVQEEA